MILLMMLERQDNYDIFFPLFTLSLYTSCGSLEILGKSMIIKTE